jgi:uncharacterized membrane protein YcfT
VALSVKLSKWKKEIDFFIRNVRGNLFQNRIYIESLFYILIRDCYDKNRKNGLF